MLSGYWVTRQYDRKYSREPRPIRSFYIARFLRLWPAYVIALLLTVLMRNLLGLGNDPVWPVALPLLGIASHSHDPLGVSWSLDIEMQFYLIAPVLAYLLSSRLGTLLVIASLLPLSILGVVFKGLVGPETVAITLSAFVSGAVIHAWGLRFSGLWAIASVLAAVAALAAFHMGLGGLPIPKQSVRFGLEGVQQSLCVGLLLVPLVGYAVRQPSNGLDRIAGDFSYSLYLVHYPFFTIVRQLAGGNVGDGGKLAMIAAAFLLSIAFFMLVDRPLERWRLSRVGSSPPPSASRLPG